MDQNRNQPDAWSAAARLVARWLDRGERVDALLDTPGALPAGVERARCQHLVYGVIRHYGRIDAALARLVSHRPRFATHAALLLAGFELLEAGAGEDATAQVAKIVHHAVEQTKRLASPAEARLVNAVTRKLAPALATPPPPKLAPADVLAEYFSHPAWLVRSWLAQFGAEATRALLEWNQRPAPVYGRWRGSFAKAAEGGGAPATAAPPEWLKPAAWDGFREVPPGRRAEVEPLLRSGAIYLQDPGTRVAVELLAPQAGETVLDACAAPGGKSLMIADAMGAGRLVAMDLPGARIDRLRENLARGPAAVDVALVQGDLRDDAAGLLKEHGLPRGFPAVLLDVPCSNTGVMRHRIDVKWRLQEGDFRKHPRQQLALLTAAARLVAPGGRIVYSTCSVDTEENEHVVRDFLASRAGAAFALEANAVVYPWMVGHDGAAAFRLRRK
ncbi:MAG TPA: RsmB/NOP family class I SAM-dependent RNA methyltransferase [Opitutus sp.]|nr:RsmB/NOP family class I SAM-dependent RNA methyltransferase [Opitutus sp.]